MDLDSVFQRVGESEGVEPALLKAIAITESSCNWMAYRFERSERRFYKRYIENRPEWLKHPYYLRPEIISASFGLMQLMYTTAILCGFPREGRWWCLLDPVEDNVRYGARWYKNKERIYGNMSAALAAYNAGSARVAEGGKFENQWYVDKVTRHLERCRATATGLPGAGVEPAA